VKEGLFYEEELVIIPKVLKNNKTLYADSVLIDFLKYARYKVGNKLLKIMNMIFKKGDLAILEKP